MFLSKLFGSKKVSLADEALVKASTLIKIKETEAKELASALAELETKKAALLAAHAEKQKVEKQKQQLIATTILAVKEASLVVEARKVSVASLATELVELSAELKDISNSEEIITIRASMNLENLISEVMDL